MSVKMSTFYFPNFKPIADKVIPNHTRYSVKNNYVYEVNHLDGSWEGKDGYESICNAGKANAQIALTTLSKMREDDYLFVIGIDAITMNQNIKIEEIIRLYAGFEIIIGSDKAGISTSQMIIKNTPQTRSYFKEVLDFIEKGGEHDQRYFWENPRSFIFKTPQHTLNSYDCESRLEPLNDASNFVDGDFIIHLAGLTLEQRMKVIDKWLGKVKQ